jgi:hypothetical protein
MVSKEKSGQQSLSAQKGGILESLIMTALTVFPFFKQEN